MNKYKNIWRHRWHKTGKLDCVCSLLKKKDIRGGFTGGMGGTHPPPLLPLTRAPYFLQSLAFCNHFEELQTMLFEVELIINDAPLIYVYPNTIMFNTQLFVI